MICHTHEPCKVCKNLHIQLLDAIQSHDCAGKGECWCDDVWDLFGLRWGHVELARATLRTLREEKL